LWSICFGSDSRDGLGDVAEIDMGSVLDPSKVMMICVAFCTAKYDCRMNSAGVS
jgi:hypothetical protein